MGLIHIELFATLDLVGQAPGGPEEDPEGFPFGGWQAPLLDEVTGAQVGAAYEGTDALLLGRRTYEIFAGYWPNAPEDVQEIADHLNRKPKHVASRTLTGPLEWQNSSVLPGALPETVAALKEEGGGDLLVIGSTVLVHSLIQHGLVDEFRLMIDPILVGGGKRIFPDDGALRPLRLVDHEGTSKGTIIATYAPA
jgi:dihydrofolate reductase